MPNPGDVVIARFPGADKTKTRPVVIVSTALYHSVRPDLILALLTTDTARSTKPTDYVLQDWTAAGLHHPTAFRAFLLTLPSAVVSDVKGQLSARDWQEVKARLRLALAVT